MSADSIIFVGAVLAALAVGIAVWRSKSLKEEEEEEEESE